MKRFIRPEIIVVLATAAVSLCLLMPTPILGVADNGDFERIMASTGLEYLSEDSNDKYFGYVNRVYAIKDSTPLGGGYISSEIILVEAAKLLNKILVPGTRTFDIRFLAVIYICIFLLAMYLIIRFLARGWHALAWIPAALMFLVFTDVGYISYFNSLYGEAVAFTSILLLTGVLIYMSAHEKPKTAALAGFFATALALATAKVQYIPVGIILAVYSIRLAFIREGTKWKAAAVTFSIFLLTASLVSYFFIPYNIRVCNKYQSLFFGVLKDSPDPEADLEELGIRKELSVLAGTNYFMDDYPIDIQDAAFLEEINSKVNPFKIALFYIRHPIRLYNKMAVASENGFKLLQGFGNYEKAQGIEFGKTADSLKTWSRIKEDFLPHHLLLTAAFVASYFAVLLSYYNHNKSRQEKLLIETFMLIGIIGAVQFIVPIIGDGEADLSKHLFLFNICFDMMLIAAITWTAYICIRAGTKMVENLWRIKRYP